MTHALPCAFQSVHCAPGSPLATIPSRRSTTASPALSSSSARSRCHSRRKRFELFQLKVEPRATELIEFSKIVQTSFFQEAGFDVCFTTSFPLGRSNRFLQQLNIQISTGSQVLGEEIRSRCSAERRGVITLFPEKELYLDRYSFQVGWLHVTSSATFLLPGREEALGGDSSFEEEPIQGEPGSADGTATGWHWSTWCQSDS